MEGEQEIKTMSQFFVWVLNQAKVQGFSVVLLILMSGLFWFEKSKLEIKVDTLVQQQFTETKEQTLLMQTIIQENTRAMDRNTRALQRLERIVDP